MRRVAQAAVVAREDEPAASGGWWAMWWRRRARRSMLAALRAALSAAAAGLHGAVGARGAGSAAADAERQARPPGAAGAGAAGVGGAAGAAHAAGGDPVRRCLPRCWGSSGSGIDDNFFALGGDSIVSIQLVSRARRAGLVITPRAVFQHQTVAALAAVAAAAVEEAAVGAVPTSPPAACRRRRSCAGWRSAAGRSIGSARRCCCRCRRGCGRSICGGAAGACSIITMRCGCGLRAAASGADVALGGGACRVRSRRRPACGGSMLRGARRCGAARADRRGGAGRGEPACAGGRHDGAGGVVRCRRGAARAAAADDPSSCGRRGVVADPGAGPCGGLAGDCGRAGAGAAAAGDLVPALGAAACGAGAAAPSVAGELPFWRGMLSEPSLSLVDGALDPARDVAGTAGHLTLTLPAAVTEALLTRVPAAFHGGINDVLLTGLALAVADWCRRHGAWPGDAPCGAAGSRGPRPRGGRLRRLDLSRTVGWFTSLFPVRLDPGALDLDEALAGRRRAGPRAEDDQGAVAGAAGQGAWLWAAALPEPRRRRRSLPALRRRSSASTIWAGSRRPARRTGRCAAEAVRLGGGDPAMPLAHARRDQCADAGWRRRRRR